MVLNGYRVAAGKGLDSEFYSVVSPTPWRSAEEILAVGSHLRFDTDVRPDVANGESATKVQLSDPPGPASVQTQSAGAPPSHPKVATFLISN
jgi:hypothetical protein